MEISEYHVQLEGFKLYAESHGEMTDKPIVVMDAGYGDYSKTWASILPEVSGMSQVLVYDRAGLGESEKSPNPQKAAHQ